MYQVLQPLEEKSFFPCKACRESLSMQSTACQDNDLTKERMPSMTIILGNGLFIALKITAIFK